MTEHSILSCTIAFEVTSSYSNKIRILLLGDSNQSLEKLEVPFNKFSDPR